MALIAIVSRQVSGVTGATTMLLEHSQRLTAQGWEVHVYGDDLDGQRLRDSGGLPHQLPRWPIGRHWRRRFFSWAFDLAVRNKSFDLICGYGDTLRQDVLSLHNCVHAAHEAVYGKPLPESSSVGWLHGQILRQQKFRLLIANSELMKADVLRRFGVPPEKVQVIYPGHDPRRFSASEHSLGIPVRQELGVSNQEILVGLITSGDFRKRGVDIFLAALGRLPTSLKEKLKVIVIGSESRLAPYRRRAAEAGVGGRIRFMKPQPQVEHYYHALDIYVHPALYEEFGLSVQEAMACGVPVLTTSCVGASELFKGEAKEMLLPRSEPEPLALALERLMKNASLRQRLAGEGIDAIRGNTWDKNFKSTLDCYKELLSLPPSSGLAAK
jgi:UDP-glucose:(heptosyl)LPS alpha-1,3-glucosyltransferase